MDPVSANINSKKILPRRRCLLIGRHVEPRTVASLPSDATQITKLSAAPAAHVVAALRQLHHGAATVASLPALLAGHVHDGSSVDVVLAVARAVPLQPALLAGLCLALWADAVAAADVAIQPDVFRVDPLTAALGWAVQAVAGAVLIVLPVPRAFELVGEQPLDVPQRDALVGATLRWHQLRILCRQ